jgi:predicted kinase
MAATLNVIFGPSGAGKTTYAHAFARREKAVAFILDDWMARLFGPDMPEPIEYEWMVERVGRCEAQIWSVAAGTIAAGTPVILDIGLMRKADRARVRQIAEATGLPL